jgi:hypothetical protein
VNLRWDPRKVFCFIAAVLFAYAAGWGGFPPFAYGMAALALALSFPGRP